MSCAPAVRVRRVPGAVFPSVPSLPGVVLCVARGPVWAVTPCLWCDLATAPAMTMLIAAVATGRPAPLVRFLTTRPIQSLGGFSYSLYLIHLPIVLAVIRRVAPHFVSKGLPTFWFTLTVALPVSVFGAWFFSQIFEMPFKRNRSWKAIFSPNRTTESASRAQ